MKLLRRHGADGSAGGVDHGRCGARESKYPDWKGQWRRAPGTGIIWDETKPRGLRNSRR